MRRITADRYMGRYGDGLPHHGTVRVLSERDYRLMLAVVRSMEVVKAHRNHSLRDILQ